MWMCTNIYTQLPACYFSFRCANLAWKISVVNIQKWVTLQSRLREVIDYSTRADLFAIKKLDSASVYAVFWGVGRGELFKSTWNYFSHDVLLILCDKTYQILKCTWRVGKRFSARWGANCTILAGSFKYSRDSPSLEALERWETRRDSIWF